MIGEEVSELERTKLLLEEAIRTLEFSKTLSDEEMINQVPGRISTAFSRFRIPASDISKIGEEIEDEEIKKMRESLRLLSHDFSERKKSFTN